MKKKAAGSAPSLSVLACKERNYFRDSAFIAISPFVGIIRKAAFGKGRCFLYARYFPASALPRGLAIITIHKAFCEGKIISSSPNEFGEPLKASTFRS